MMLLPRYPMWHVIVGVVSVGAMLVLSPVIEQIGNICSLVPPAGVAAQPAPTGQAGHTHAGAGSPKAQGAVESPLPKENMMTLSPERLQAVGVKFELAKRRSLDRAIRTVGQVEIDERRLAHVNIKLEGWIDELFVNSTGERVTKGQKLLTLYSPELVATQTEYLLALKSQRTLGGSTFPEVAEGAQSLARGDASAPAALGHHRGPCPGSGAHWQGAADVAHPRAAERHRHQEGGAGWDARQPW